MPGLTQFSQNVQVQANPNKRVRYVNASYNTPLAIGQNVITIIYSPPGYYSRVIGCLFQYPFFASSAGDKKFSVNSANGSIGVFYAECSFANSIFYRQGRFDGVYTQQWPEDKTSQFLSQEAMVFDEVNGLEIGFTNNTDAPDGGISKSINFWVQDEKIL